MSNKSNSLDELDLNGNIKSVTVIFYDTKKIKTAEDLIQKDKIAYKEIKTFDINGMLIENSEIGADERLISKQMHKFDERGNLLEMKWHRFDSGKISGNKAIYVYDKLDNTLENCWYDIDDHLTSKNIYINESQYFANVPEVSWNFYIGGYQPVQKWMKDRKGRALSFEDIMHYQKIIVALSETDRIMREIEKIARD